MQGTDTEESPGLKTDTWPQVPPPALTATMRTEGPRGRSRGRGGRDSPSSRQNNNPGEGALVISTSVREDLKAKYCLGSGR